MVHHLIMYLCLFYAFLNLYPSAQVHILREDIRPRTRRVRSRLAVATCTRETRKATTSRPPLSGGEEEGKRLDCEQDTGRVQVYCSACLALSSFR